MIKYCVCGLGYDENNRITDYEMYLGDFDNYEEAYEFFVKLQCRNPKWFFRSVSDVYQLLLQLEECEDDGDEINCIDVKNEWWITNPNFKKSTMNRQQFVDYVHDNFNVSVEFLRLLDNVLHYAELQCWDEDEKYDYLDFMLDCNIGLEDEEIRQIKLEEDN